MFKLFTKGADEAADAGRQLPSFEGDSFAKRLVADVGGRTAEQPARAASATSRALKDTAKIGGGTAVAGGGLYVGNKQLDNYSDVRLQESKEASFEEYQQAREDILENENLTPEEREEMLEALKEDYDSATQEGDDEGGLLSDLKAQFNGLGMVEKTIVAVIVVTVARQVIKEGI